MKSERRHELMENTLAKEIGQMKSFFARYGNWVIGLLAAILFIVAIVAIMRNKSASELARQRAQFEQLMGQVREQPEMALQGLGELANSAKDENTAAQAALAVADTYAGRLLTATGPEGEDSSRKAEEFYRLAIARDKTSQAYAARGHLGLGVLAENAGKWDQAKIQYEQVLKMGNSLASNEATQRLANLAQWAKPVRLISASQAALARPSTAPAATSSAPATTAPAASAPTAGAKAP